MKRKGIFKILETEAEFLTFDSELEGIIPGYELIKY